MARRIPWDEQEALLLFDAYEKVQKYPEKKSALINALSINLRRRASDNNVSADDTFRNYAGISMRLSEVEKILHPDKSGLEKTSELFRTTAELYCGHRRTFLKKVQEVEEYRVKVLSDTVGFDLYESVVLLDACLNISAPGETKAHIARLTSAKLRALAINRGCVINEAFRSDGGIAGRLRKMEEAFQSIRMDSDDVPQIFIEAVKLFYNHRNEYKRILKYANSLIGKIILPEDVAKIEKAKQQIRDAAPVEKTLYVKTKKDRKLKENYPKEFVAVYKMLERRCYVDLSGVTATDLFVDLKKKYQRKVIIEILDGASWAKETRAGKYVHALGASMMAIQESNERKFFAWVKPKLTLALYQEMQKNKGGISLLLLQKKVIKKPLFLMDDAEEVAAIVNRASSCFASSKTKNLAVQLVTLYATYLKEKMSEKPQVEEEMSAPTPSANANEKQYVLHMYFAGIQTDAYDNRYSILADNIDSDTAILWIDALGAEWLPLLKWTISKNCDGTISDSSIGQANLPTETCYNDLWNNMDTPYSKLDKLDKLAHKGVIDEPDYYTCIEEQISFVSGIHKHITGLLKKHHRVIVTGDHGTSRLAARFFHIKDGFTAPKDSTVCSHGRYCKVADNIVYATPNTRMFKGSDGLQYMVYTNYDHFKQSGFAAGVDDDNAIYGEVHGGATPEEMLVPVIVIDSNAEIPLTGTWEKSSFKIMMKKARLSLSFNKPVHSLQLKVAGVDAEVTTSDGGKYWNAVVPGIKQGTYTAHVLANNILVEMPEITILPALGGGDGDLP